MMTETGQQDGVRAPQQSGLRQSRHLSDQPAIVVVGSMNVDFVVEVPRLPHPGETIIGGDLAQHPGGKGANQAVAAARLGQHVAMVGRVGVDEPARLLVDTLREAGVDTGFVETVPDRPTGIASITVDADAENTIVVSPGANSALRADDVERAADVLAGADAVLLQLEIPLDVVEAAARAAGGTVVLNPAPARDLPAELLQAVDVLVLNETELELLAGAELASTEPDDVAELARRIDGPAAVVVTLGAAGAVLVRDGSVAHVPALPVQAVDTTAAGDAFCGALADALVRGEDLAEAVQWAVRVAAVVVTRLGAQRSLPDRATVQQLTGP